jgi:hypothetical protein
VAPRLEFLETRCLMSGSLPRIAPQIDAHRPIWESAVTRERVAAHAVHHRIAQPRLTQVRQDSTPVMGNGEYRSTDGSPTDASTSPIFPGLPQEPYAVVLETKSPHQSIGTAQDLPRVPFFGVVGSINPGDPIDLYRLTLASRIDSLDFAFRLDQPAPTVPLELQLFDGSGQVLNGWSLNGQITTPLHAEIGGLPAGTTLYLGISAGNSAGQVRPAAPLDYQLWVSLKTSTESVTASASAGSIVPTSALVSAIASPLAASMNFAGQPSSENSQAARPQESPRAEPDALHVAVGSAAVRLARPTGGLLSDGEAAPPAARDFNASVNKEWDERSVAEPTPGQRTDIEPTALAGRESAPEALVVMPGPSGFPLVGAVAIGHRRSNPAGNLSDLTNPPAIADRSPEIAAGRAVDLALMNRDIPATRRDDDPAQSGIPAESDWAGIRVPVFSGLGLATVFTLNAVFSQPIGGFDYLTSRLDAISGAPTGRKSRLRSA